MKLLLNALVKFLCGIILVGLLVFLPAGTFQYPNGCLFAGLLFVPMLILGVVLFKGYTDYMQKVKYRIIPFIW